jgi:hypothetical protein
MTSKPDIRFIIDIEPSKYSDSLKLSLHLVVLDEHGKIRNPSFGWDDNTGVGEYADLVVEGWCDRPSASGATAFTINHEVFSFADVKVDLRRAESIIKTLRRLDRKMRQLSEKLGAPADAAATLSYVAQAVGCKDRNCFGRLSRKGGWSYDDNDYSFMDVDALRFHLSNRIEEWNK